MRTPRFIASFVLALVAATALVACGGAKKSEVPAGAIAIVGSEPIPKADFDWLMTQAKAQYVAKSKKPFPAIGSKSYQSIKDVVVAQLVQNAVITQQATKMGIKVTEAEVDSRLKQGIKEQFNGSQAKYQAYLKKLNLTEARVKDSIRANLVSNKVKSALDASVSVSSSEIKDYYNAHKSTYKVGMSRAVSHILLKTKAQADNVYQQLKAGGNFAKLAKKYSIDNNTKNVGGKLGSLEKTTTLAKPFAKVLFSDLKTGTFSKPVQTIYGWHIIEPTGPTLKPHLPTLREKTAEIQSTLQSTKQNEVITNWVKKAEKYGVANTSYASDFAPTTTSTSTVATTTT